MSASLLLRRASRKTSRTSARGFTLIELLVAVIAGLFVVLAAFLLSKGSTRLFGEESRVASAQLNLRIGIDRLRSDLARAGLMSTSNVVADPDVCPKPAASGFATRLQSILYVPGGSYAATKALSDPNGLNPDSIIINGNFAGSDYYLASSVEASGAGYTIYLQRNNGAMQRLLSVGAGADSGGDLQALLDATFPTGKLLRLTNNLGSSQFLLIQSVTMGATINGLAPQISLKLSPSAKFITTADADKKCGVTGFGLGATVNAVQFMRYDLRNLAAIAPWAYPDGDTTKFDLVRTELNPDGTEVPGCGTSASPQQIVAEYVVDLKFAFSIDDGALTTGAYREPNVIAYPFNDATATAAAGDVTAGGGAARPQRIRSVRFQITTRSRDGDRSSAIGPTGSGLLRYLLPNGLYARTRTDVGEVALLNQQSAAY